MSNTHSTASAAHKEAAAEHHACADSHMKAAQCHESHQDVDAKLNIEVPPYRILGACNPPLAHRALTVQPDIGLLLPCNVIVRQEANASQTVGFMDPVTVMQMTDNAEVAKVATEVRSRLERVRSALLV